MKKRFLKKVISLIAAISVAFAAIGAIPAGAASEVGAVGDGWGYFFFRATGLDSNCKIAYSVNGGEKVFLESDFEANWIRIDKDALKTDGKNTITFYTGNASGILDETKSRTDAGKDSCDYTVTTARLALVLPDGRVICKDTWGALKKDGDPFTITTYTPVDENTPLSEDYTTAVFTGAQLQIGDDKATKAYKADITFDTSLWNGTDDPEPVAAPTLKNVSIQIGATPSDRRFVWYSRSANPGYLQYTTSDKLVDGAMPSDAAQVAAVSSVSGDTDYYSFMADISGLADNTTYAYRVGNDDAWSQVYTFKTDDGDNPFSFIVGSDIQIGQLQEYYFEEDGVSGVKKEIDGWVDTYNKISEKNPNASFFVSLGDQISDAYIESQFDGLFAPEQMRSIPFAVVYGNHDDEYSWQKHWNVPNPTQYGLNNYGACDYSFVYGDALFMHLTYGGSTPEAREQHTTFIEETLLKHPDVKWRIVIIHTPFFGASTQETDDYPFRDAFAPEFSRLGIDVVLAGHQHVYCRAKMMNGTTPNNSYDYDSITEIVNPNASDVLYMTIGSASGSAYNKLSTLGNHVVKAWQQTEPNISNVEITDTSFKISTYKTTDMENAADEFTLKREENLPVVKSVHILADSTTVKAGTSQTFTAKALGLNNPSQEVVWSVSGNENNATTIDENGVLSVAAAEFSKSLTITAASAEDSEKYESITVDVETTSTTINVGQGVTYALPDTVNSLTVTEWTDYDGETVTEVDTEYVGCRYYTATLSDGTQYVYRVNVGEYKELMKDTFETYTKAQYEEQLTGVDIGGGKFSKDSYSSETAADGTATYLTEDRDNTANTVMSVGPYKTAYADAEWKLDDSEIGDAFKVSFKVKVLDFDPTNSSNSNNTHYFIQTRRPNVSGIAIRAKQDEDHNITATQIYCYPKSGVKVNNTYDIKENLWTKSTGNGSTTYSMTDYLDVSWAGNGVQYSAFLGDTEIANSIPWAQTGITDNGLGTIQIGKTDDYATTRATVYIDDVTYSKAIYPTDKINDLSVSAEITQGAASAQAATVTLNMSDKTTKDFTVKYTADTSVLGTQEVEGTIDGFDDTIPVTVTVKNVITGITATDTGIEKATIQQVGNVTNGVAVFAYYGSDHKMATVKSVPFTENNFTDGVAELNVGLVFPENTENGYIKGFVFNNLTGIIPLDAVFSPKTSN